jgi:hypothetical protein
MASRSKRLKQLVELQHKLKAIHETRHAIALKAAAEAQVEADEVAALADTGSSLGELFPGLHERRIGVAIARKADRTADAEKEAGRIAAANVRGDVVKRYHKEAVRQEERSAAEKDILEILSRPVADK